MISIYFKEVFTTKTREYFVNPEWITEELYTNLSDQIRDDFNININDLELIDNLRSLNGHPIETHKAIPKSTDIKVHQLFGRELKHLAFYIRRKYRGITEETTNNVIFGECFICCNERLLERHYQCTHHFCNNCYNRCLQHELRTCPLCRCS